MPRSLTIAWTRKIAIGEMQRTSPTKHSIRNKLSFCIDTPATIAACSWSSLSSRQAGFASAFSSAPVLCMSPAAACFPNFFFALSQCYCLFYYYFSLYLLCFFFLSSILKNRKEKRLSEMLITICNLPASMLAFYRRCRHQRHRC